MKGPAGAAVNRGGVSLWEGLGALAFLPLCNPRAGWRTGFEYLGLLKSQWATREELDSLQARKLGKLLRAAVASAPHYAGRPLPPAGRSFDPREFLASWPILTKEQVRGSGGSLRPKAPIGQMSFRATTGGTTGTPIEVWKNQGALAVCEAALWRGKSWLGIRPWDRGILAYGFGGGSWYGRLRVRLTRKVTLDAFGSSEESRRSLLEVLDRTSPVYIEGFITDLLRLGDAPGCDRHGLRQVITTAEMLYEGQREALAKLYGARVSDYYGSNEVNSLAFECEVGRKHVTDEHVILETVDDAGIPVWDAPGRILVTDLDNLAMPLVRYELGDTGTLTADPCPCGRRLTVLSSLLGRPQDALRNEEGERLSAVFFAGRFKELKGIRRFQLVQRTPSEVDLFYEVAEGGAEQEVSTIVGEITGRLGAQMIVRPTPVETLDRTEAGKCRLVVGLRETP